MNKVRKVLSALLCMMMIFSSSIPSFAAEDAAAKAKKLEEAMRLILENYVGKEITAEELYEAAMKGMFDSLDPYTQYFNAEEIEEFLQEMEGKFTGIGVVIAPLEDGTVKIEKLFEQGPAEKAGLQIGDIIKVVDGQDLTTYEGEPGNIIKGKEGTQAKIKVLRNGKALSFTITRAEIKVASVYYEVKEKNIGYIEIANFNEGTASEFKAAMAALRAKGAEGLVLDLRGNPGGYMSEALDIARQLIPNGPIVYEIYKNGYKKAYNSELKAAPYPIAVLINGSSASASEVLAGAIQDRGVGVLVGETSFGKGIIQQMIPQEGVGAVKMTVAEYVTPNQRHIHKIGLTPDIVVPYPYYLSVQNKFKKNDKDVEIKSLELSLKYLGYFKGNPDETYDAETVQAVKAFQKAQNIYAYGVADFSTQAKINESIIKYLTENDMQLKKGIEVLRQRMLN